MKLLIAATSGGHLTEAMLLFEDVIASSDETIVLTNTGGASSKLPHRKFFHRQFGPIWLVLIQGFIQSFRLMRHERPDWLVTTGAEVAVFSILAARLLGIQTVFVETVTRRENPTRAARLSYWITHHFYVQHPETLACFGPRAKYIGGLM